MKINYLYEGNGDKTLVFIHGLSDSLEYWQVLSSALTDDYKVLSYDIRGHGGSDYGNEKLTIDLLRDDLYNLFLKLNIEKATIIGFSLGGHIALSFILKYPELCDKMILMSTFSESDDNLISKSQEFKQAINISYEAFYDVIIKYVIPKSVYDENKDVLEYVKMQNAKTANLKAIGDAIDIISNFNITDQLSKIDNQTLILAGHDDDIVSLDLIQILNDNIKNSELVIFDNTKHNLLIGENVREILKLLRQFL